MRKPPKRWSVNAFSEGMAPISYFFDGRPLARDSPAEWEYLSPVQHLLIAVAGCFALSCRAVALKRGWKDVGLEVVVTGDRSAGSDNRISSIVVAALFRGNITAAQADELVEEAKPLCTVANTLLAAPAIVYESRTIKTVHRAVPMALVAPRPPAQRDASVRGTEITESPF